MPLEADEALALWTDLVRWPTFVEGFSAVERVDGGWPGPGAKLVWRSINGGRGRVTERVCDYAPAGRASAGRLVTEVFEEALAGTQSLSFEPSPEGDTRVHLQLEYELQPTTFLRSGPIGRVTDVLFIRRALSDSLARTLRRFATEAAEEASL